MEPPVLHIQEQSFEVANIVPQECVSVRSMVQKVHVPVSTVHASVPEAREEILEAAPLLTSRARGYANPCGRQHCCCASCSRSACSSHRASGASSFDESTAPAQVVFAAPARVIEWRHPPVEEHTVPAHVHTIGADFWNFIRSLALEAQTVPVPVDECIVRAPEKHTAHSSC